MTGRKLRIYGEILWSCVGMTLLAAFFPAVIMGVGRNQNVFFVMAVYSILAGAMILVLTPIGLYQSFVPVIFSVNCTRKKLFHSFQIIKVLNVILITAVCSILMAFQNIFGDRMQGGFLIGIGFFILLFMASVGNFLGALYSQYGRIIMILFMILSMLSGGVIGFVTSAGLNSGIESAVKVLLSGNETTWLVCAAAAAGFGVLADGMISWMIFQRYEVRS